MVAEFMEKHGEPKRAKLEKVLGGKFPVSLVADLLQSGPSLTSGPQTGRSTVAASQPKASPRPANFVLRLYVREQQTALLREALRKLGATVVEERLTSISAGAAAAAQVPSRALATLPLVTHGTLSRRADMPTLTLRSCCPSKL